MSNEKMALWQKFNEIMESSGYRINIKDGGGVGYGSIAYKNSDKWIPTIALCVWADHVAIFVNNRCGSKILNTGPTLAIYSYKGDDVEKMKEMAEYAIEKWGQYSKTNPLIFTDGEDEVERIEF